jgi:hypothetical protein
MFFKSFFYLFLFLILTYSNYKKIINLIFQDKYSLKSNFKVTILLNITQGGEKKG